MSCRLSQAIYCLPAGVASPVACSSCPAESHVRLDSVKIWSRRCAAARLADSGERKVGRAHARRKYERRPLQARPAPRRAKKGAALRRQSGARGCGRFGVTEASRAHSAANVCVAAAAAQAMRSEEDADKSSLAIRSDDHCSGCFGRSGGAALANKTEASRIESSRLERSLSLALLQTRSAAPSDTFATLSRRNSLAACASQRESEAPAPQPLPSLANNSLGCRDSCSQCCMM